MQLNRTSIDNMFSDTIQQFDLATARRSIHADATC